MSTKEIGRQVNQVIVKQYTCEMITSLDECIGLLSERGNFDENLV